MDIIFDFDSTLIGAESLDLAMELALEGLDPAEKREILEQIKEVTNLGMEGVISLKESFQKRMELVNFRQSHLKAAAKFSEGYLSIETKELIRRLKERGLSIFIVSGGLDLLIEPVALILEIPLDKVKTNHFAFKRAIFDPEKSRIESRKINQVSRLNLDPAKTVAVGDGWTDLELYEEGLVEHFIGYTEYAQRKKVLQNAPRIAHNTSELKIHLEEIYQLIHQKPLSL
jgi:D-3-phosphoglycerate dehydrogenase